MQIKIKWSKIKARLKAGTKAISHSKDSPEKPLETAIAAEAAQPKIKNGKSKEVPSFLKGFY